MGAVKSACQCDACNGVHTGACPSPDGFDWPAMTPPPTSCAVARLRPGELATEVDLRLLLDALGDLADAYDAAHAEWCRRNPPSIPLFERMH